ncbi:MAG: choice-of-anchor D domain-containing protein [Nitrospiraceae bacterium]|nr:choice-of-anchor D domain-containing protein [Nitrospiraceae bacterium]
MTNLIPDRFGNFQEADLIPESGSITFSAGSQPLLIVASSNNTPDISVSPLSKDFGSVNSGSFSSPQTVTVTNNGTGTLSVSAASFGGDDPGQFSLQSDNCTGHSLLPTGTCALQALFSPKSGGLKKANLLINSNDPDTPSYSVALQGTGIQYTLDVGGATGSSSGTIAGGYSINCAVAPDGSTSGSCSEIRDPAASITLTAAPSANSYVDWTNCSVSYGNACTVTLDSDKTVFASFTALTCQDSAVKNPNATPVYCASVYAAYAGAADGDTIQIAARQFEGDLLLDRPVEITLDGGYDCAFDKVVGSTTLKGSLTISAGTLTANNLVLSPGAPEQPNIQYSRSLLY